MKFIIVLCLALSGCSTVSQYKQGCLDGVSGMASGIEGTAKIIVRDPQMTEYYCSMIENRNKSREQEKGAGK